MLRPGRHLTGKGAESHYLYRMSYKGRKVIIASPDAAFLGLCWSAWGFLYRTDLALAEQLIEQRGHGLHKGVADQINMVIRLVSFADSHRA